MTESLGMQLLGKRSLFIGALLLIVLLVLLGGSHAYLITSWQNKSQFEFRTDPVRLSAHRMLPGQTHYDHAVWAEGTFTVPEDSWITELSAELEGAPASKVHNFYLYRKDIPDMWCPNNPLAIWAGSTVTSRHATEFPQPYGIQVRKGDVLLVRTMFIDPRDNDDTEYPAVSLIVKAGYELSALSKRSRNTALYLIGPHACDTGYPIFPLPPHSLNAVYGTYDRPLVFQEDGQIIKARGHYHGSNEDGKVISTLRLFMNGRLIDEASSPDITDDRARNPVLLKDKIPFSIKKGDSVSMEAILSNPSDEIVPEGMAIVGLFFSPLK